jgi:Fe-S oxidoreductase
MAKLKAEFLQHWYKHHPVPLRTRLIAHISRVNQMGMLFPWVFNRVATGRITGPWLKGLLGFARERSIPTLGKKTLRRWARKHLGPLNASLPAGSPEIILYVDEFTNYNDTRLGLCSIRLFHRLGIKVKVVDHPVSARTYISKGLLIRARKIARKNVEVLFPLVSEERPLVGIEPSAILGFRDEFPELVGKELKEQAMALADHCYTLEEYIDMAHAKKWFSTDLFTKEPAEVLLHGHCQQKAMASTGPTLRLLSIPENYRVKEIPSGCCGMAGSFGYEKEHFELSMKVGELVLFPAVRDAGKHTLVAAPGTSCRHQILDGTGTRALHPVEILYNALA